MAGSAVKSRATWVEGLQFVAVGEGSGSAFVLDGSATAGGGNGGMRPTEALLSALAACTSMDVVSILRKKRQRITGFEVHATGQRADEHPRRFLRIALDFVVRGVDVDPAAVERSIQLSHDKYCGVTASLNAEVVTSFRIENEPALQVPAGRSPA